MADPVKPHLMDRGGGARRGAGLVPALMLSLALLASPAAQALGPTAPFMPPAALLPKDGGPAAAPATATPTRLSTEGLVLAGMRLQHHPMALLDGRWLRPGQSVRDARIVAIERRGVTLQSASGHHLFLAWNRLPPAAPVPPASTSQP